MFGSFCFVSNLGRDIHLVNGGFISGMKPLLILPPHFHKISSRSLSNEFKGKGRWWMGSTLGFVLSLASLPMYPSLLLWLWLEKVQRDLGPSCLCTWRSEDANRKDQSETQTLKPLNHAYFLFPVERKQSFTEGRNGIKAAEIYKSLVLSFSYLTPRELAGEQQQASKSLLSCIECEIRSFGPSRAGPLRLVVDYALHLQLI